LTNLVLFNSKGGLQRYNSPIEILDEFFHARLKSYSHRKQYLISKIKKDLDIVENKVRFIREFIAGDLKF
jgi:DNA topoisomerase-2